MRNENGKRHFAAMFMGGCVGLLILGMACGGATAPKATAENSASQAAIQSNGESLSPVAASPKTDASVKSTKTSPSSSTQGAKGVAAANAEQDSGATGKSDNAFAQTKVVRFEWCPKAKAKASYELHEEADQHRIVIPKGVQKGGTYPVVVAFHGQPKRGKDPREYMFMEPVQRQVLSMVEKGDIQPVILVMPVFRYLGSNWPYFNPKQFQQKVIELLAAEGVKAGDWYAFGHSGAAGCGGDGLNQVHLMNPKGVGFFDTCLGKGWQQEVKTLQQAKIETFNIHSVETAGFKPRQYPEYQSGFDFGRAYSPLGIEPVECPAFHPGEKLRTLPYRCSATPDGIVKSFVVDTGDGAVAHKRLIQPAVAYFLKYFFKKK